MPESPAEGRADRGATEAAVHPDHACGAFEAAAVAMRLEDLSQVKQALDALRAQGVTDLRAHLIERPELAPELMELIRVRDVNRQCLRLHEASSKRELLARYRELILPETYHAIQQALVAIFEGRRDFQMPTVVGTVQGERRNVMVAIRFPARDAPFDRVFQSMIDITEQTRAQAERELVEARYQQAVETSPIGVFIADPFARIRHANPAMHRLLGYEDGALPGLSWKDVTHPDDMERSRDLVRRIASGDFEPVTLRKRYLCKDGSTCWGQLFLSRLSAGRDGAPRILGYIVDITQQVEDEEQRERLDEKVQRANMLESLGVLAGGVAHDFNNLLVGVMGHAGLARGKLAADAPVQTNLQQIELAAARAAELTNQMLAYSGGGRFVLQTARLGELVGEMRGLLEVAVPTGVDLHIGGERGGCGDGEVQIDVTQVRQLVMNLVTNAAEAFVGDGGMIRVETGTLEADAAYLRWLYLDEGMDPGRYAYLEVADTGSGIEVDVLKHIFDPFFTTKSMGRGLGLAAVLGIVRGHGGGIRIESTPGRGTKARVLLPLIAAPDPAPADPAPESTTNGERPGPEELAILVADDKSIVLDVARQMLESEGHTVDLALDGVEAVDAFERGRYDLVILDLTMPRMSGVEACRKIQAMNPKVPVVLSSGHAPEAVLAKLGQVPTPHFIRKPYRVDELLASVAGAVAGR